MWDRKRETSRKKSSMLKGEEERCKWWTRTWYIAKVRFDDRKQFMHCVTIDSRCIIFTNKTIENLDDWVFSTIIYGSIKLHLVMTDFEGRGIDGAKSLNVSDLSGTFTKIFLVVDINLSTSGKYSQISSANLCNVWAGQVTGITLA